MRRAGSAVVLLVAAGMLTGCSAPSTSVPTAPDDLDGTIIVDAAASLTESFNEIADEFARAHPGVTITLNFGGSSGLAESIRQGAPVDVFAAASSTTMATIVDAGLASDPAVFASNSLEIVVPADNPGDITSLADFADPDRTFALCAPEVPCGAAATKVFAAAGITAAPDTLEEDVKSALTKVRLGEVDAALVYRTDVLAAGDEVTGIDIPESADSTTEYPIAVVLGSASPEVAEAFVEFVFTAQSQRILSDAGFETG